MLTYLTLSRSRNSFNFLTGITYSSLVGPTGSLSHSDWESSRGRRARNLALCRLRHGGRSGFRFGGSFLAFQIGHPAFSFFNLVGLLAHKGLYINTAFRLFDALW